MDFDLTPEQEEIRKLARDFADREIAPGARERDRGESFPHDILRKMAPVGFLGGPVPEQYGGMGVDYISHALITEEIGRADSSVRTTLSVQISLVELTILRFGTEEQKQTWLPRLCKGEVLACFGLTEPAVGSDATKLQSTAKRDGSDWLISGRKMWISNGSVSKLALIFANADPAKGDKGITAFLVDRDRSPYGSEGLHGKLGLRSSDSSELIFDAVRVPDSARLGEIGQGFKIAMASLDSGRFFFFQAEDGIRDYKVTRVQTCALPISPPRPRSRPPAACCSLPPSCSCPCICSAAWASARSARRCTRCR